MLPSPLACYATIDADKAVRPAHQSLGHQTSIPGPHFRQKDHPQYQRKYLQVMVREGESGHVQARLRITQIAAYLHTGWPVVCVPALVLSRNRQVTRVEAGLSEEGALWPDRSAWIFPRLPTA